MQEKRVTYLARKAKEGPGMRWLPFYDNYDETNQVEARVN
jgi:hypothetical protein